VTVCGFVARGDRQKSLTWVERKRRHKNPRLGKDERERVTRVGGRGQNRAEFSGTGPGLEE